VPFATGNGALDPKTAAAYDAFRAQPLGAFQDTVAQLWSDLPPAGTGCAPPPNPAATGGAVQLSRFQQLLQRWFTSSMPDPVRGVLLHASAGVGKTCAAIAAASAGFQHLTARPFDVIWWVGPPGVRSERNKHLATATCSAITRAWLAQNPGAHRMPGAQAVDARGDLTAAGRSFLADRGAVGGGWMPSTRSYRQLLNFLQGKAESTAAEVRATRRHTAGGGGPTKTKKGGQSTKDPLYRTLLILDEVDSAAGGSRADGDSITAEEFGAIQRAVWASWDASGPSDCVRVLAMTATPVRGHPVSFFRILNLCVAGHPFPNTAAALEALVDPGTGLLPHATAAELAEQAKGAIMYTDAAGDRSRFAVVRAVYDVRVPLGAKHEAQLRRLCDALQKDPAKRAQCLLSKENSVLGQAFVFDGKAQQKAFGALQALWKAGAVVTPENNPLSTAIAQLRALAPKVVALVTVIAAADAHDAETLGHKRKHVIFTRAGGYEGAKFIAFGLMAFGFRLAMRAEGRRLRVGNIPDTPIAGGSNAFLCLTKTPLMGGESAKADFLMPAPGARTQDCAVHDSGGSLPPTQRRGLFNLPENAHGEFIRLLVLDASYTVGVDVFDVAHEHLFEHWPSDAAITQAVRRGTRLCGQTCLQPDHLGWPLNVYRYTGVYSSGGACAAKPKNGGGVAGVAPAAVSGLCGPWEEAASLVADVSRAALGDQLLNLSAFAAVDRRCNATTGLNPFGAVEDPRSVDLTARRSLFPADAEHIEWPIGGAAQVTIPLPAVPAVSAPSQPPVQPQAQQIQPEQNQQQKQNVVASTPFALMVQQVGHVSDVLRAQPPAGRVAMVRSALQLPSDALWPSLSFPGANDGVNEDGVFVMAPRAPVAAPQATGWLQRVFGGWGRKSA
jgi:hypothetical protein